MKILITGASSGLGAELARQYATKENELILLARRLDKLLLLKQQLLQKAKKITLIVVDVTDTILLQKKLQTISTLDMVILNAGISLGHTDTHFTKTDTFQTLINVNLIANHAIIEVLLPILQQQTASKIVFISSLASLFTMPSSLAYSSSKRALNAYAEGLRYAYHKDNIKVINILPGFIQSELTDKNDFYMPFFLPTDKGVQRIIKAIQKDKKYYPFPKRFYFLITLLNLLPYSIKQKIIQHFL